MRKLHLGGVKHSLDRRGGLPHYFPCARDELRCICSYQFHGLASACSELLLIARIIRVVEKPELAHARARVRYPLDEVLGEGGDSDFSGISAQRGGSGTRILPGVPLSQRKNRTCTWAARASWLVTTNPIKHLPHVRSL